MLHKLFKPQHLIMHAFRWNRNSPWIESNFVIMKTLLHLFSTNKVIYDEDGCFEENIYLGINNKYLHYLQVRSNFAEHCQIVFWPATLLWINFASAINWICRRKVIFARSNWLYASLLVSSYSKYEIRMIIIFPMQFAKMIAVVTMVAGGAGIIANCLNIFVLSRWKIKCWVSSNKCFNNVKYIYIQQQH